MKTDVIQAGLIMNTERASAGGPSNEKRSFPGPMSTGWVFFPWGCKGLRRAA